MIGAAIMPPDGARRCAMDTVAEGDFEVVKFHVKFDDIFVPTRSCTPVVIVTV